MMRVIVFVACLLGGYLAVGQQEFVIENAQLRWTVDNKARTVSLVGKATGKDYAVLPPVPMAFVVLAGKGKIEATSAKIQNGVLKLEFGTPEVTASLKVDTKPEVITMEVLELKAPNPTQFAFLHLPVSITAHVGRMMAVAWDDEFGIIALGLTRKTCPSASRTQGAAFLHASGYEQFGFNGCKVGLVAAPIKDLRMAIHRAAKVTGLPAPEFEGGKPIHMTEENRKSYLFTDVSEANVERCIRYAKEMNFGQIMMFQWCWAKTSGHFEINTKAYPKGEESLKATVAKIRAAGLKAGFHLWASKVHKSDKYCTPIPDRRLWKKAKVTLAEDIDDKTDRIITKEPPKGFYGEKKDIPQVWKDIQIGDEIITYERLSLEPPFGFFGCKRGANGTRPAHHKAGEIVWQLGIDDCCPGYIIDQETDLLDEVADRCAGILNRVGCDMIYFDGGEDVPPPLWYYVPNFELAVWNRLIQKPIIVQGTIVQHHSWHIFSRNSTVDIRRERSKEQVDNSVKYMLDMRENLLPGELGWFGIFPPDSRGIGTQFDEIDYLCCKALAYDAPFSIEMSLERLEANPLFPSMVRQIGFYEKLRLHRYFKPEELEQLKQPQVDFTIFRYRNRWRVLKLSEVKDVPGKDLRLFLSHVDNTIVAYFWNTIGEGDIELTLPASNCQLIDDEGKPVKFKKTANGILLPLEPVRRFLICEGLTEKEVEKAFKEGQMRRVAKMKPIYIQAESGKLSGKMILGKLAEIEEPEALGDVVTFIGSPSLGMKFENDYAEYTVKVPSKGIYAIWARLRYPKGGDMSFTLVENGAVYTGEMSQALGNSGNEGDKWHWDSQGTGLACKPGTGRRLVKVTGNELTFRIYPREGSGGKENPRLDVLCITNDLTYVPTDADAIKALGTK